MYRLIVKRMVRRGFERLSAGDYEAIVKQFGPRSRLVFSGDHAFGGERRGQAAVREWFRHVLAEFPGLRVEPVDVVVNGWPWNTTVATHLKISATAHAGRPYTNEGMQLLRLRWGRVAEDLIFEDTEKLVAELRRRSESSPEPVAAS